MNITDLPALGQPLEAGTFAGLTTRPDGTHCAVVLLADKPSSRLGWKAANAWAESVGGTLPNRPTAALLFATLKSEFEPYWHWTSEVDVDDGAYAWDQHFDFGNQSVSLQSYEGRARAVRLIHLVP